MTPYWHQAKCQLEKLNQAKHNEGAHIKKVARDWQKCLLIMPRNYHTTHHQVTEVDESRASHQNTECEAD